MKNQEVITQQQQNEVAMQQIGSVRNITQPQLSIH
jgi:hypothetical protein